MQLTNGILLHGGTYKIEKVLGQGSFGITYLAEHVHLGRKVAIKEFFMKELNSRSEDGSITGMSDGSLSYNYAQKFKKEALNLSRLDHPNIVRVTDSFEDNGTFYYVMDFIDGMNLNDYIKSNSPSEQTAVEIIKEVANALEYMHEEKQMLHLDLKPGNVMRRNSDGHIFLIDFGLSKHYDANGAPETSTTIGLGTAGYAPVEQANQAKNGDFRPTIDVYSLGATLYKLLTHDTPPAASELVSDDELLPEKMKEKGISQPLIDFVVKAMLPNVRKRIQTIREFKELLQDVGNTSASSIGDAITNGAETITNDDEEVKEVHNSEETEVIGNSEETELITDKAIHGNEADYEKFDEKQYSIPSSYITNIDETMQNASSGNVGAMLALGFMYLRGQEVTQNLDTAYSWFTRANFYGDYRARKMVAQWMQIKDRYAKKPTKEPSKPSADTKQKAKKDGNQKNAIGWVLLCILFIILLPIGVKKHQDYKVEKEAAEARAAAEAERAAVAAEKARIESIAKNTKDWYGAENGQFYCMVEGERYYVSTYGIPDGQRTVHYSNGDTFVGNVKGGSKSQGKYTYKNGDYFNGTFSYGSKDTGYGKETSYDGKWVYEGNYRNGMQNGKGTERWPKEKRRDYACMLECTYNNNQRHGIGTWYYNDHTYAKKRFTNGKMGKIIEEGTWR